MAKADKQKESTKPKKDVSVTEEMIEKRRRRLLNIDEILYFLKRAAILVIFLAVMLFGIFGVYSMGNNDMMPRIAAGDVLIYYRLDNNYVSQDIVVYHVDGKNRIGRIVARPGDTVEITEANSLSVNGFVAYEEFIFYSTPDYDRRVEYPLTLGDDEYFLLCDYREGARDSRYYGAVLAKDIRGKVVAVVRWMNL